MVRATRGRRSGPMTMSATTAITISSENPTSNTGGEEVRVVQKKKPGPLPASACARRPSGLRFLLDLALNGVARHLGRGPALGRLVLGGFHAVLDRKSTRLNSSHLVISYAVFCLKKKKKKHK